MGKFTDKFKPSSNNSLDEKSQYDGDENKERGNWSGKLDFFLSVVGYAFGLGNVWRFPYRTFENGGASFLIPYVIILAGIGLPLFFLEMALGQFASLGPVSVWKVCPAFTGIGWAMVLISGMTALYYNMIIAYVLYYLFASFTSKLPWSECRDEWIQYGCYNRMSPNATIERNMTAQWCLWKESLNETNSTDYIGNCTVKPLTASEIYWEREVLDISGSIAVGSSDLKWDLVLCLLLAWILCGLCLIKGVKSSGKVVYFTALFPYVVLVILLIWNAQLEGAEIGIKYYLIPDWERLKDGKVWYAAGNQIFFSLGVGFGGLETMASYNKFHNNVYRDSVLIALINCGTSIFAGFVIFSVIGHMSYRSSLPVSEVAKGGPGLAFVVYPEGLSLMPVAPLWAILFFMMFLTLGLDSQFAFLETIITAVVDYFPALKKGYRKMIFIAVLCCSMFLLGLPQCSRAGIYVMNLFDWYCAGLNLMLTVLFEIIGIIYIYGFLRFSEDIKMMIGHKPDPYWLATWIVVAPALLLFIFIFSIIGSSTASYGSYVYPGWADGIGWLFVAVSLVLIPIFMIVAFCQSWQGSIWSTIKTIFSPADDWGPALDEHRTGRYSPLGSDTSGYNGTDSRQPYENKAYVGDDQF